MNVLIIAHHSISMVSGGPDIQVRRTVEHFAELGCSVELFNPWEKYDLKKFDIAHVFVAGIPTYDIARRLKHFGIPFAVSPIIFALHSGRFIRMARRVEGLARKFFKGVWTDYGILSTVCNLADIVLPNTTAEAAIVRDGLGVPEHKICVIPNGVDERFADGDPTAFINAYNVRDFILNVGHIGSERKNVLSLIRAVESIERPTVIIGKVHSSPYADQCLREAKRNPNITIIEGLPNDSDLLASAYAASSVFALPSWFETPGIAALEAGLAGANIVITKNGGTEDYFGDHAEYVDPFRIESIRNGIIAALDKPRNTELREHIRNNYLWRSVAEKTVGAYREVLG